MKFKLRKTKMTDKELENFFSGKIVGKGVITKTEDITKCVIYFYNNKETAN